MTDAKPTPGPWHQCDVFWGNIWSRDCKVAVCDNLNQAQQYREPSVDERKANARLITEAGTAYHETGLTPRQLAEHRAELLETLEFAVKNTPFYTAWIERARAAIARARGEG